MEQLKEVARLVNAAGDEDGVAVFAPDQGEKTFCSCLAPLGG
jgi:hypothetical protein